MSLDSNTVTDKELDTIRKLLDRIPQPLWTAADWELHDEVDDVLMRRAGA